MCDIIERFKAATGYSYTLPHLPAFISCNHVHHVKVDQETLTNRESQDDIISVADAVADVHSHSSIALTTYGSFALQIYTIQGKTSGTASFASIQNPVCYRGVLHNHTAKVTKLRNFLT